MTRYAIVISCTLWACAITPEQFRDDQWCDALTAAEDTLATSPFDDSPVPLDLQAVHLQLGDYAYIPAPSGRKHIVSNERIDLQVVDESGQFATQVTVIDEHLCDAVARRWILELEPRPYFLQLRALESDPIDSVVLLAEDDADT